MTKMVLQIVTLLGLIFLMSGCTNEEQSSHENPAQNKTEIDHAKQGEEQSKKQDSQRNKEESSPQAEEQDDKDLTQKEIIEGIKEQIDTELTIVLPDHIPLQEGEHLTAATTSENDQYTVTFFASQTPIPINNEQLNDDEAGRQIARLTVQQYNTQEQADEEIAFEDFSKNGGNEVDLGYGITGYQDAGAGSLWTGWNEGRWALATHTQTDQAESGEMLARETVTFLEDHSLPIPEKHGFVHLDATGDDQRIIWQKGKIVYQIDQIADPIVGLEIATLFK